MTTMMEGNVSTDSNGNQVVTEGFDYVWQILGSVSSSGASESAGMSIDIVNMCNINMVYFAIAVLVCLFVSADFKSGYAKNLFTVRVPKKNDYVVSKTVVCSISGVFMILAFVLGALIGGAISSISFETVGFSTFNLICSVIAKAMLVPIFVSVFLTMSVVGKQKTWLAMCLSLGVGMFLFMIISIVSPLDAGLFHILLSLAGSAGFAFGMGTISNAVLKKTNLI